MNARRPRPVTSRPPTSAASLALRSSTAGWYAAWKEARTAAPAAAPVPPPPAAPAPSADAAEAVARWLSGGDGK